MGQDPYLRLGLRGRLRRRIDDSLMALQICAAAMSVPSRLQNELMRTPLIALTMIKRWTSLGSSKME